MQAVVLHVAAQISRTTPSRKRDIELRSAQERYVREVIRRSIPLSTGEVP